jgi:Uma2 family endonuclease
MSTLAPVQQTNLVRGLLDLGNTVVLRGVSRPRFTDLIRRYPDFRFERDTNGTVIIIPPTHGGSSIRENNISYHITHWQKTKGDGATFSPTGGFDLPDGATKCPDVAWVSAARMAQLTRAQIEESYIPLAPDFVAEIRSRSDNPEEVQRKIKEIWIANGVRLAWLIDPYEEKAWVYRADGSMETVEGFDKQLSGEDVLPDFVLELSEFRLNNERESIL